MNAIESGFSGIRDKREVSDKRSRFFNDIVLAHRNEEIIFAVKENAKVFSRAEERVIGSECEKNRFAASQVRFNRHSDSCVGDA